jgi:hypothetical protein
MKDDIGRTHSPYGMMTDVNGSLIINPKGKISRRRQWSKWNGTIKIDLKETGCEAVN